MNTKTPIFLTLLALLLFFQGSCEKVDNDCPTYKLPPATQSGENTIGCLVDDVVLVPNRGRGWNVPYTKRFRYNEETGELFFWIIFYAEDKDYECGYHKTSMRFSANSIFNEGEIEADKFGVTTDIYPSGELKTYRYRSFMTGISSKLKITKLDTTKNIISGIFSFEAYRGTSDDYNPNDKLNVTEGRFDFNYYPDGSYVTGYSNDD